MARPPIHRSTKIVFGVVMFCFGLFNVVVFSTGWNKPITHGWPFAYLDRQLSDSSGRLTQYLALTQNISFFSVSALIANPLIALAISLVIAAGWECLLQKHLRKYGTFRRFGLRHLLLAMGFVAILAGMFGRMTTRAVKQSYAIRQLEQTGPVVKVGKSPTRFSILYWWFDPRLGGVPKSIYAHYADLRDARLLSADAFQSIEKIHIRDSQLSDKSFEVIGSFRELTSLHIASSNRGLLLPAKNFESICKLNGLDSLSLDGLDLRTVDMRALEKLKCLHQLSFLKSIVDDSQLDVLAELPELESVNLSLTPITDSGFLQLTKSKSLEWVGIQGTSITPAAIERFHQANPRVVITH